MAPDVRDAYVAAAEGIKEQARAYRDSPEFDEAHPWPYAEVFTKAQEFERLFVAQGGLLGAGTDPCCPVLPGFGDQRNVELLTDAGFSPAMVIKIMTANGAKVLGGLDDFGTIEVGKLADLVVIEGDIEQDRHIQNTRIVFRHGIGWDAPKLIESVRGIVGIR